MKMSAMSIPLFACPVPPSLSGSHSLSVSPSLSPSPSLSLVLLSLAVFMSLPLPLTLYFPRCRPPRHSVCLSRSLCLFALTLSVPALSPPGSSHVSNCVSVSLPWSQFLSLHLAVSICLSPSLCLTSALCLSQRLPLPLSLRLSPDPQNMSLPLPLALSKLFGSLSL